MKFGTVRYDGPPHVFRMADWWWAPGERSYAVYYRAAKDGAELPSASYWIVPGTLDDASVTFNEHLAKVFAEFPSYRIPSI